jgi:hypothetical protein
MVTLTVLGDGFLSFNCVVKVISWWGYAKGGLPSADKDFLVILQLPKVSCSTWDMRW